MPQKAEPKPPELLNTLSEWRAVVEFGAFNLLKGFKRSLPSGDGHSVLVLPGFLASDVSTRPMRRLLKDLGYSAHGWGLGRNLRFDEEREAAMSSLVTSLNDRSGQKISIVGWSLGGVFARELAKSHPDRVRSVISLGSPISGHQNTSNARRLFNALNKGKSAKAAREAKERRLHEAPPVPTTSILTKSDGVVHWRGSVQAPSPMTENIIVPASHFGLGVNPLVMVAIADRLARPEGGWTPFDRSGWRNMFFSDAPHTAALPSAAAAAAT